MLVIQVIIQKIRKQIIVLQTSYFVLADDQGWNGTSVKMMYNESGSKSDYFETPNLELLSQKGMRFSDAYASALFALPQGIVYSLVKHLLEFH